MNLLNPEGADMTRIPKSIIGVTAAIITLAVSPVASATPVRDEAPAIRKVIVGEGVELH